MYVLFVMHASVFSVVISKVLQLQVLVPKEEGLLGRKVTVDIVSCSRHSMMGRIVRQRTLSLSALAALIKSSYLGKQVCTAV